MGFNEGFIKKVKLSFKISLFLVVFSIFAFFFLVFMNGIYPGGNFFTHLFLNLVEIFFYFFLLLLIITGVLRLIIAFSSSKDYEYLPESAQYTKDDESKPDKSINYLGLLICTVFIITGIILFIYGDITFNQLHGSAGYASMMNVNLYLYEFIRIGGGVLSIAGFLGLVFVGFSK